MHDLYQWNLQTQGYLSAADSIGLSSFTSTQKLRLCLVVVECHSRLSKLVPMKNQSKARARSPVPNFTFSGVTCRPPPRPGGSSPRGSEKPIFGRLSKRNIGMATPRAVLPVTICQSQQILSRTLLQGAANWLICERILKACKSRLLFFTNKVNEIKTINRIKNYSDTKRCTQCYVVIPDRLEQFAEVIFVYYLTRK